MTASRVQHAESGPVEIGPIARERSFPLRQAVLRPHQRVEEMDLPGSDQPDAVVIGAVVTATGAVVSTAAMSPEEAPEELDRVLPPGRRWRLRSMATEPSLRSSGLGSDVLAAALGHVADHGGGVVWCSARVPALRFYERAGFAGFGEIYETPDIGPHRLMWREVAASAGGGGPTRDEQE